ncbi:MAG: geranylgeranylglyceryl/heptaprenylglyceryl phosphate synthase, partial [Candidatus Ranarchaeia archaeon]
KLEPIGMAYIIIEPGGTAGYVGQARPIPRDKPLLAGSYALAAQFFGFKLIYLEAGSGADNSVPLEMISTVKKYVDIPVIVGGGIRTKKQAADIIKAGADLIVQGTFVEETLLKDGPEKLRETIEELKKVPKTRGK